MKGPRLTSTGVVLALVSAMLVTGVVVAAAHGGGPNRQVIHACVDNQTGAIEIVNANDHCGAGEDPLDWNGKGPPGPQGPPGPAGESGFANITVVTATSIQNTTREQANLISELGVGVGVDCPGDSIATGGGGSAIETLEVSGSAAPVNDAIPTPLLATYPLEKDSTSDPAETGDRPTGWYAMGGGGLVNQPSSTQAVTVWAVCADTDPGPPPDEDD